MQDMPLVSVIVPVYKSIYLRRCIDSVLSQTYKNFELILIDDESPDGGGEICDKYAETDQRVKVIHQKNGGISAARNKGLDICQGDIIFFYDDDDYSTPDMIEEMVCIMCQNNSDVVLGYVQLISEGNILETLNKKIWRAMISKNINQSEMIIGVGLSGITPTIWCKAFKKSLWNNVRFPIKKMSEDRWVAPELWAKVKSTVFLPKVYYYWDRSPHNSASQTWDDKQDYDAYCSWSHCVEIGVGLGINSVYIEIYTYQQLVSAMKTVMKINKFHILSQTQKNELNNITNKFPIFNGADQETCIFIYQYSQYKIKSKYSMTMNFMDRYWKLQSVKFALHSYLLQEYAPESISIQEIYQYIDNNSKLLKFGHRIIWWVMKHNIPFVLKYERNRVVRKSMKDLI